MKILFDQGTPLPLRAFVSGHSVFSLKYLGWSTLLNGALIDKTDSENFDCFITTDQNLSYQQNLHGRKVAIFVLMTTDWRRLKPRAFDIANAVSNLTPGSYTEFVI